MSGGLAQGVTTGYTTARDERAPPLPAALWGPAVRSSIHLPKLPKPRLAAEGFPALAFLLLLIVNDWLLARHLRSPAGLLTWLSEMADAETTIVTDLDALDPVTDFLLSPGFPLVIVALMVLIWIVGAKRGLLVPLIVYLVWATLLGIGSLLVVGVNLFNPTTEAEVLLIDTLILWVSNSIVFAAWYWLVDRTGQAQYSEQAPIRLHFLFPQTSYAMPAWESWKPGVFDYLYLSFIVMAQFRASDTIPLTRLAKSLVMIQTVIALFSVTLIASRAIGLVK